MLGPSGEHREDSTPDFFFLRILLKDDSGSLVDMWQPWTDGNGNFSNVHIKITASFREENLWWEYGVCGPGPGPRLSGDLQLGGTFVLLAPNHTFKSGTARELSVVSDLYHQPIAKVPGPNHFVPEEQNSMQGLCPPIGLARWFRPMLRDSIYLEKRYQIFQGMNLAG